MKALVCNEFGPTENLALKSAQYPPQVKARFWLISKLPGLTFPMS